jgi:SAM-dependent methyltransferase
MTTTSFYDHFHENNDEIQYRVIHENSFTYYHTISLVDQYFINPGTILDVGCGVGTIDFYLSKSHKKIFGVDISKLAIAQAKKSKKALGIRNVEFIVADITKSWLNNTKYDYLICSEVLEHVLNDEELITHLYSKLKDGGVAIFSVPSKNAPLFKMGLLKDFDKKVGHVRRYSVTEIEGKLHKYGFISLETRRTESVLRNSLYTFKSLGILIKLLRHKFVIRLFMSIDYVFVKLFGESDIYVVVRK